MWLCLERIAGNLGNNKDQWKALIHLFIFIDNIGYAYYFGFVLNKRVNISLIDFLGLSRNWRDFDLLHSENVEKKTQWTVSNEQLAF